MSHFVCIVAGNDHEAALAPFHEFECTGVVDEFVETIEITDNARSEFETRRNADPRTFLDFAKGWYDYATVPYGSEPDLDETHKYGYIQLDPKGGVAKVINRTNPNAQWDWYVVGGRWDGFLSGENYTTVGDVDWDAMRGLGAARATEIFDAIGDTPLEWVSWADVDKSDIEKAREFYHDQPNLVAVKEKIKDFTGWMFDHDELKMGREAYTNLRANQAITPFAFIDEEGGWNERGRMGWWGMASDEKDSLEWADIFWEWIQSLDPSTPLTVIDCHI